MKKENFKAEIIFNMKCLYNYQFVFFGMNHYFHRLLNSP